MKWIDKLEEQYVSQKADEDIRRQRHELVVAASGRLCDAVEREIKTAIREFSQRFPARAIKGPDSYPHPTSGGWSRVSTQRLPICIVDYQLGQDRIVFRLSTKMAVLSDEIEKRTENIWIRADFGVEPWFEHNGDKLFSASDVAERLLKDLFEHALK